jgi:hypothetical protein
MYKLLLLEKQSASETIWGTVVKMNVARVDAAGRAESVVCDGAHMVILRTPNYRADQN